MPSSGAPRACAGAGHLRQHFQARCCTWGNTSLKQLVTGTVPCLGPPSVCKQPLATCCVALPCIGHSCDCSKHFYPAQGYMNPPLHFCVGSRSGCLRCTSTCKIMCHELGSISWLLLLVSSAPAASRGFPRADGRARVESGHGVCVDLMCCLLRQWRPAQCTRLLLSRLACLFYNQAVGCAQQISVGRAVPCLHLCRFCS